MSRKWTLAYGGIGAFLGVLTAQLVKVYIGGHAFEIAAIIGVLPVSIILIGVNLIQVKRKKDNTPDMDERTQKNILKFQSIASHIFIALLFISLVLITYMEIESVSTSFLWIIIFVYLFFYGIGTFIAKSR